MAAAAEKEKSALVELLKELQEYQPELPDGVLCDLLAEAGFETEDPVVRKLIALAARKYISEISNEAIQNARNRDKRTSKKEAAVVLTPGDLSIPLAERGIHLAQPDYLADRAVSGAAPPK
eukprot:ANDGO_05655.mRNA.1 Transcription initiation factor TFIID subunit 10